MTMTRAWWRFLVDVVHAEPARPTILSFVPASMISLVTFAALRTTRPS